MEDWERAALTPMWQRIADGEVDLSGFSDEEIETGQIIMRDGRMLPAPPTYPDTWVREQVKRGLRKAQRLVRVGAMDALEVYSEILNDDNAEDKDRIKAGEFFLTRFLGKEAQHVVVHDGDAEDAREVLIQRLLAARQGLPATAVAELGAGRVPDGTPDDAVLALEDLI